jgi:hypothetical protein
VPVKADQVIQPRVHPLYRRTRTAVDLHLALRTMGPEAPVHPKDLLAPPLIPRVRDDGLNATFGRLLPEPSAGVLGIRHQPPHPTLGRLDGLDEERGCMPLLVLVGRCQHARQRKNPAVFDGDVELIAQVEAPTVPAHPGIRVGETSPVILWVAYAPRLDERGVEDRIHLLDPAPPQEHDRLLVYDPPQTFGSHQLGEAA